MAPHRLLGSKPQLLLLYPRQDAYQGNHTRHHHGPKLDMQRIFIERRLRGCRNGDETQYQ